MFVTCAYSALDIFGFLYSLNWHVGKAVRLCVRDCVLLNGWRVAVAVLLVAML